MNTSLSAFRPLSAAIRPAILVFCLSVPLVASAELNNESLVGPGLRWRPAYDGSDSQRLEFVPVVRYLGKPWFVRSTQGVLEGGIRMELTPGLHAGAQLAYETGRQTNDADFLDDRNVSGINPGASVGLQLEWDLKVGAAPITVLGRVRQHTDSDRGAQADLRLSVGVFRSGRLGVGAYAQGTWANAKSTDSYYGITPQQSAVTGLPPFSAGSGLLFASFGLIYSIDVSPNWVVVGHLESRHLQGDAARSPIVERSWNYYISTGLAYRF